MLRFIALFITLLFVGCSAASDEEIGSVSQPFHAWSTYHWPQSGDQVQLNLSSNLSSAWLPYLNTASTDWNQSSVLETTVVQGTKNPRSCKPTLGQVEVCNAAYGKNGWLGIAQVWVVGGHITQAVVKLNDSYFTMAKYNTVAYKRLVVCQEVGHAFGLDHQDEVQTNTNLGTCMDYTNNPAGPPSNEHPNAHDYEELESIYAHVDALASSSQATNNHSYVVTHVIPAE